MYNAYPLPQKQFREFDLGEFYLREKRDSDVEDFLRYYNDPEVNKYIMCEIPRSVETALQEMRYWRGIYYRDEGVYFAIARKSDDRLVGTIGLTSYNAYQSRMELSYDLAREFWRQGISSHAIDVMLQHGFKDWRVNRIEAYTSVLNEPSRNLLLKKGFTLEGVLRQHRYHLGRYVDVHSFSILRQDYTRHLTSTTV
jgi:ribosomal-protein-alanine N-acetyltransferase